MNKVIVTIIIFFTTIYLRSFAVNAQEVVSIDSTGFRLNGVLFGIKGKNDSSSFNIKKISKVLKGNYKRTKYPNYINLSKGGHATLWTADKLYYSSSGFITNTLYHRFRKEYNVTVVVHGFVIDSNTTYSDIAQADILKYSAKSKLSYNNGEDEVSAVYLENISNTGITILINMNSITKKVFCIHVEF